MKIGKSLSIVFVLLLVSVLLTPGFSTVYGEEEVKEGSLVIIGGALKKDNEAVYNKFIELGGGAKDIKIAIMPMASADPVQNAESYKADFIKYGVKEKDIKMFPIAVKDDKSTEDVDESTWAEKGKDEELAKEIEEYSAVFFVGGDQMRIVSTLVDDEGNDTPVLAAIRKIYSDGGVIGGTSAGAAIMTDPMISGGTSLGALTQGITYEDNYGIEGDNRVFITKGLGFLSDAITDQHFIKRGRLGRLIAACFNEEINMGYGVDENTALVVKGSEVEVVGESGVVIVDISSAIRTVDSQKTRASRIKIHYLEKGDKYNTLTNEFIINEAKTTTEGYEYYEGNSINTNIFGIDGIKQAVTVDLVDNTSDNSVGLSFELREDGTGTGVKLIFTKGEETQGFWGKIDGKESYAATNVYLEIVPIGVSVQIEETSEATDVVNQ